MVVTCDIEFVDNTFGTYFAGQLVSGTVTLKSDKPKDVKAVLLKVIGYSDVFWREKQFGKKQSFFSHEDYMATLTYLLGSEHSTKCTLQAGTHEYTFACQLPYTCPTSFEGSLGHVRYVVKVVLIRPWKYDQTYTRGLTVLRTVDLNYEAPQIKMNSHTSNYKSFCCGPCTTEPLQLELSLAQSGFVPGQNILVTVLVINNTNIQVSSVEFSLVMLVRYFSSAPTQNSRIERIVVSTAKGDSVLRNCTRSISADLHVPATPPTCHNASKLIQIAYQVEAEAKMKGMYSSQVISTPVVIGTVPLWNSTVTHQPTGSRHGRALVEEAETAIDEKAAIADGDGTAPIANPFVRSSPTAIYPDLPPPTYEESEHTLRGDINEGELHTFGRNDFAPLYPVYNLSELNQNLEIDIVEEGGHINESYIG